MATGTASLNFGAHPGSGHAKVAVTGQAAIVAGSLVEAWLLPADTANHKHDEHLVVPMKVTAGNIIAGTGFTIHGFMLDPGGQTEDHRGGAGSRAGRTARRTWGLWNCAWAWATP